MQVRLKNKKFFLLGIILFQLGCFSKTNTTQQKFIKAAALKEDFDILRKTLEEAHPGLYWYSYRPDMNIFFDSAKASIQHDMTSIEFFKMLLPVIANIKCIHTSLRLPKDTNNTGAYQFTHLLPFDFFCRHGKVYIQ